ncbi:MAG: ACT domain-containing protein [bacterium]|nr:ACT domain-containing protein [bacterium]
MNSKLKKIIKESVFKVEEGRFVYTKVAKDPNTGKHFMVSRDADEITVVTREESLPGMALIERNKDFYRLVALNVSVPFYSVGLLAAVSQAIAKAGMNILIVSTYSKDYILVKDKKINNARSVLLKLGFQEIR